MSAERMRNSMIPTCLLVLSLLLGACAHTSGRGDLAMAQTQLPAENPAAAAMLASFEAERDADIPRAMALALDCGGETSTHCAARTAWLTQEYGRQLAHVGIPLLQTDGTATDAEHTFAGLANIQTGLTSADHDATQFPADVAQSGLASTWTVLGPVAVRPFLSFDAVDAMMSGASLPGSLALDSGPIQSHEIWTSSFGYLSLPNAQEGVYLLESWLHLSESVSGTFLLQGRTPAEVWIDGVEVAELASAGEPGFAVPIQLSAGVHQVRVKLAHSRAPIRVALLTATGSPAIVRWDNTPTAVDASQGSVVRLGAPTRIATMQGAEDPLLDWLLAAQSAALAYDLPQLHALEASPPDNSALVALWRARLLLASYDLPEHDARARAVSALVEADSDSVEGLLELAQILLADDRQDEALDVAYRAEELSPDSVGVLLLLEQLYGWYGWDIERRNVMYQLRGSLPDDCRLAYDFLDLQLRRGNRLGDYPESWQRCRALQTLIARRVSVPLGDDQALLTATRNLALSDGGNLSRAWSWYEAARIAGELEEAEAAREWARRFLADDAALLGWDIDTLVNAAPQLRERADVIWRRMGPQPVALDQLSLLLGEDLIARWRVDGLGTVQEYLASEHTLSGDVIYVLDASTSVFEPTGANFSVVHQIVELRTRDALDRFGEVGVPAEGTLLQVRTIKRDGRVFVPEDVGATGALSMPNLEIGDFIELEWVEFSSPMLANAPVVRSPRFFFRTIDNPLFLTTARYVYPAAWSEDVVFDTRNFDGEPLTERVDGRVMTTFALERSEPADPEALRPDEREWMPSTQFAYGVTEEFLAARYANRLASLSALQPHQVDTALQRMGNPRRSDMVRSAYRWMVDEVVDGGWFFAVPASETLLTGEGERLVALYALLRALDFDVDVVFVSTFGEDETQGAVPDMTRFDLSALRVQLGSNEVWLEPDYDSYPFDYLRTEAQGRPAVIVSPERLGQRLTTPTWDAESDTSYITVDIDLNDQGDAQVSVRESIPRRLASNMRSYIQTEEDLELVRRELGGALAYSFGSVGEVDLEITQLQDPEAPLTMVYSFIAAGFADVEADGLVWEGGLFERQLAGYYASSPSRSLALMVDIPTREQVRIEIRAPRGLRVVESPNASFGAYGDSIFIRESNARGRTAVLERQVDVPIQRVEASEYEAFVAFLDGLAAGSRQRIVWRR